MEKNIKIASNVKNPFSRHQSYSVNEIIAAGGTTAFANKLGKGDFQSLINRLKELPKDAFLTDEEAEAALKYLRENK